MEFFEAVQKRRSCRRFTEDQVPETVIEKAFDAALLAPNSSNLQPWEFYWVRDPEKKKKLSEFCFSQGGARTADQLVVAVARLDTWNRNRRFIIEDLKRQPNIRKDAFTYYEKLVPIMYFSDLLGVSAVLRWLFMNIWGLFKPMARGPSSRAEQFEVVVKTTALACENFMLAISAQGYDTLPMEGFDACRVKKLLKLNRHCHIPMVIGVGKADPRGIWGERFRIPKDLVIKKI